MSGCVVKINTQREDFTIEEIGNLLSVTQRYKRVIDAGESIVMLKDKTGVAILIPANKVDYVLVKEEEAE